MKVGPTLVKSGLVYSMKNINTTTSFSLSPVSTKWYHPPMCFVYTYQHCMLPIAFVACMPCRHITIGLGGAHIYMLANALADHGKNWSGYYFDRSGGESDPETSMEEPAWTPEDPPLGSMLVEPSVMKSSCRCQSSLLFFSRGCCFPSRLAETTRRRFQA